MWAKMKEPATPMPARMQHGRCECREAASTAGRDAVLCSAGTHDGADEQDVGIEPDGGAVAGGADGVPCRVDLVDVKVQELEEDSDAQQNKPCTESISSCQTQDGATEEESHCVECCRRRRCASAAVALPRYSLHRQLKHRRHSSMGCSCDELRRRGHPPWHSVCHLLRRNTAGGARLPAAASTRR